jgi:hypothetical protein
MAGMTAFNRITMLNGIPRLERTERQTNERNRLYASLTPRQRSQLRPRTRTPRSRTPSSGRAKTPSSPNSKRDRNLRKSRKSRKINTRKY